VQDWKVSALPHLKHLASDVIEVVVTTGKKTASQLKKLSGKVHPNAAPHEATSDDNENAQNKTVSGTAPVDSPEIAFTLESAPPSVTPAPTPQLGLGVRIIVQNESTGWNGACGIITDIGNNDDFWVLLDHAIAQGRPVKSLLKSHQLRLERPNSAFYLTTADIELLKAETIKQYKLENAEAEQAKFAKIKGAAEQKAKKENASFEKHAQNMTEKASRVS
jgi:hypothetical protein